MLHVHRPRRIPAGQTKCIAMSLSTWLAETNEVESDCLLFASLSEEHLGKCDGKDYFRL